MVRALLAVGFVEARTTGDHIMLERDDVARPVVVPKWDDLPDFIVANNLRTAGISRKRYIELLTGKKRRKK